MEYGLRFHMGFWRSSVGTILLYPALTVHASLGLWALYQRRQFKWKSTELIQLIFGLSIPALLCWHLISQRVSVELYGLQKSYGQTLFWMVRPDLAAIQVILVIVAWTHACIGLGLWLRLRPWFPRAAPYLLLAAVLLPLLALLGFYQQGKTVQQLAKNPQWVAEMRSPARLGTPTQRATLLTIRDNFFLGYAGAIGFVFAARGLRRLRERSRGLVRLSYPDRAIRVPRGLTVLEASLRNRIPHASVCGGKGRCSTCRIRIIGDRSGLPRPSAREAYVLERVGASADPAVRLACQLRPQKDIALVPMLPPQTNQAFSFSRSRIHLAQERYVVCMFVDMRGSVRRPDKQLPFDTVFMINRFLAAVSQTVLDAGGRPHQYLGDGLMALFGLRSEATLACRQAINAAAMIAGNLDHLNKMFVDVEHKPISFGIGIHGGEVIAGDIGYRDQIVFSVIGDTVNIAARLQEMTKELACEVAVSDEVLKTAGVVGHLLPAAEVAIRGRADPLLVRGIEKAAMLATVLQDPDAAEAKPGAAMVPKEEEITSGL
jgi:adenylate cyclase